MLTLMLFRHAKSSWDDARLADFDRPLAARGIRAADAMAQHIRDTVRQPEKIVCSPAKRARETLAHLLSALPGEMDITMDRALYDLGSPRMLWDHVRAVARNRQRVMLVGHNPLLEGLASLMIGTGDPTNLATLHAKYPTGALAVIDFDADDWSTVEPGSGRLSQFVRPRDLTD